MASATEHRLAFRLDEIAQMLGVSRRTIERLRSAGKFPQPDIAINRMCLWCPETLQGWMKANKAL
jgi:predicted DNA-binding transcriptional regulator AlpA